MSIRGDSKLNAQAKTILKLRQEQKNTAQIHPALEKDGLAVGYSTLRDWLHRHPEKAGSGVLSGPRDSLLPRSLGWLEAVSDEERFDGVMGALRILWLPGMNGRRAKSKTPWARGAWACRLVVMVVQISLPTRSGWVASVSDRLATWISFRLHSSKI